MESPTALNGATESVEEWKVCAQWLAACGIINTDHPSLEADGNVIDFVQLLRSGVALCCLLNKLSNGELDFRSMDDYTQSPGNSQFLCCRNIRLFSQLCRSEFDIPESFIVDPADIYQVKNIGKAIHLLSKLSLSAKAQSCEINGFECEALKAPPTDLYTNLEAQAPVTYAASESNYAQFEQANKEKIYDTLVVNRTVKSPQPAPSGPNAARCGCIKEIVETEKHFVELLVTLIDKYKTPLTGILSEQEISEILMYIDDLHTIHRDLYAELCIATGKAKPIRPLHEIFITFRDRLLIYGEYCGHVEHAQSLIQDMLRSCSAKGKAIEKCQTDSDNYCKFQLDELLTVPAQRVLKYHVLLESLNKLTPAEDPDKPGIQQALQAMRELAQAINEFKRDSDAVGAINRVRSNITGMTLQQGWKLSDYGRLHSDGDVKMLNEANQRQKSRYLFLFDRIVVICKAKGDSFEFFSAHFIKNIEFGELALTSKKGDKYMHGFTLPIAVDASEAPYKFFAKSAELRTSWLEAAKTALHNLQPPSYKDKGYHFEMHTFTRPTYCTVCKKILMGCFFQGYRCRYKHIPAHKACLVTNDLPPVEHHSRHSSATVMSNGSFSSNSSNSSFTHPCFASLRQSSSTGLAFNTSLPSTPTTRPRSSTSIATLFNNAHQQQLPDLARGDDGSAGLPMVRASVVRPYSGECPCPPPGLVPLCLQPGDIVDVHGYSRDSPWCQGIRNGVEGWFPANVISIHRLSDGFASIRLGNTYDVAASNGNRYPMRRSVPASDAPFRQDAAPATVFNFDRSDSNSTALLCASLTPYDWYVGEMNRAEAVQLLTDCDDGTFLVRVSTSLERRGELSISVVYLTSRHIRINRFMSPESASGLAYGLCESTLFPDIPSLIDYYSRNSLKHCFDAVDITLAYPYTRCPVSPGGCLVRAKFDFYDPSDLRFLAFRQGDSIVLLNRATNEKGLWKGWFRGKIGFFPQSCVDDLSGFNDA